MAVSIEIKNINEFRKFMEDKQKAIKETLPDSIKDAVLFLHRQVKISIARGTNAPVAVDTGRFLNSVDFEVTGKNEAKIFTDIEYAKFIEYGTSKMEKRPHFGNTTFKEKDNIKQNFNVKIKSAIK